MAESMRNKKDAQSLAHGYVARLLGFKIRDVPFLPPDLIELKSLHLTMKREVKNEARR
jgi:hypothetical protein